MVGSGKAFGSGFASFKANAVTIFGWVEQWTAIIGAILPSLSAMLLAWARGVGALNDNFAGTTRTNKLREDRPEDMRLPANCTQLKEVDLGDDMNQTLHSDAKSAADSSKV